MKTTKTILTLIIAVLALTVFVAPVKADLVMDSIQFDPAIISSGDEVDIIIQYHDQPGTGDEDKSGNPDYQFKVKLEAGDTITREFITIQDSEGDDLYGIIFGGEYYNKKFRVKVNQNAPAGTYTFKMVGQWYYNGVADESYRERKFSMDVKKEGIILNIASLRTEPAEVRPGDNYVKIITVIENSGEKSAKSIEINQELPDGLKASYTDNNRQYIGKLEVGESKEINFFIDVDDYANADIYTINHVFTYSDIDNNQYSKEQELPFNVKPRPYLEVVASKGSGLSGSTNKLQIKVKNTGTESAEAVDVRIIKQNSQPFDFDVRSDYIGELEPGEEGIAIINVDVNKEAENKEYDLKVLIRSKGDSDEGDDNIYTYTRRAKFTVTGSAPDYTLWIGLSILVVIIVVLVFKGMTGKKKRK